MSKISWKLCRRLIDAVLAAAFITTIAFTGCMDIIDLKASDWLYQKAGTISPDIIVIGIDPVTLDKLGPIPSWIRRDMAKVIQHLNNNPDSRPAVIGIDVMFTGDNPSDPDGDRRLVDAASQYGNVVVASDVFKDYRDAKKWIWDPPFGALAAVTANGHIEGPDDPDGITRHDFLYVDAEEYGRLYSFPRVIYGNL